ncbi:MAG: RNA polymerase sigma factor, partial [Gemmataceae bacterium]|nr:RNA polymerase sigma factor [Gemmataceae bacterium]
MKPSPFLDQIRRLFFAQGAGETSDAELLAQFCKHGDEDAFGTLVHRHGPIVWRVCRRMLRDEHLAEDVFQATFLVLARRAPSIRRPDALPGWLHGVATRLALKARLRESKRQVAGVSGVERAAPDPVEEMTIRELRTVLDEELLHLPDKFRYPLVLCYLEGKTRDEAAQLLDCPLETLKSRLERGRELLHSRLSRRQLALPTAFLSLLLADGTSQAAPRAVLLQGTAEAAFRFAGDAQAAGALSQQAVSLAQGYLTGVRLARWKAAAGVLLLLGAVTVTGLFAQSVFQRTTAPVAESIGQNDVFEGPPAPHVPRLRADVPAANGPLRRLVVEERVGTARANELVRVPLFFHEGECQDPHGLRLFATDDRERQRPIAYQPDDVRRDEDGSISRMHIYFMTDLRAWERQQFVLAPGENPGKKLEPVTLRREDGKITLAGDDLQLAFWTQGPRAGGIAAIQTTLGKVTLSDHLLAPRLTLQRQAANLDVTRTTELSHGANESVEVRDLRFGSGPLFAKLIVRIGPPGVPDSAEFIYLVPRRGSHFVQSERLLTDDADRADVVGAAGHALLAGRLVLGDSAVDQRVVLVPAGLRRLTRSVQGHTVAALVNARSGVSMLPVPHVHGGMKGIELQQDGDVAFLGTSDFRRTPGAGSDDLRAFWGQVRYVFTRATSEEALWEAGRAHFQPLTAVVEEPGVTADDLHGLLKELMRQHGHTHARSWMQEAGRLYTLDDSAALRKLVAGGEPREETTEHWLNGAISARNEATRGGTVPLREDDKGKASGPLDPWNLTYTASAMVSLAALAEPSPRLDRISLAIGKAQRQFNGRVDGQGLPSIDCYHSAFTMQMGSIAAGIHGARKAGDADLLQFYRDCARSPNVLDVFGHAQRTNPSAPRGGTAGDFLYASTSDFFLRNIELACNEDLWIHPAAFGRYFDCVDVNADLCQRMSSKSGWYRANYFRGQCSDRRWQTWSAAPFLGLLAAGDVGLTDACYYARHQSGQRMNWIEVTTFFQTDVALRAGLSRYRPEAAPALPQGVEVLRQESGNRVRWKPLADVQGYRIYRAERMGGPWTVLNSPYTQPPGELVSRGEYTDADGT